MASVRRSTSRLLVQTHNTEAQRRLYSKKPGSRNPIPKVNARGFDTTFDVVKPPRPRRDAATSSLSKFVRVEVRRRDGGPMSFSEFWRSEVRKTLRKRRYGEPMSFPDRMCIKVLSAKREDALRARRDGGEIYFSELVRTCVQSPMWWIQTFIVIAIFSMLPPWEDNPENREWVEKYCPWASWGLVKSKKQREQEESAGADR